MSKLFVRLLTIILNLFIIVSIYYAWNGMFLSEYDCLFSTSFLFGVLICVLMHEQGKYHCVYMRSMGYNLVITPIANFLDLKFGLFDTAEAFLIFVTTTWAVSTLATIYLAITHFRKVKRLKRERNEIHKANR